MVAWTFFSHIKISLIISRMTVPLGLSTFWIFLLIIILKILSHLVAPTGRSRCNRCNTALTVAPWNRICDFNVSMRSWNQRISVSGAGDGTFWFCTSDRRETLKRPSANHKFFQSVRHVALSSPFPTYSGHVANLPRGKNKIRQKLIKDSIEISNLNPWLGA